MRVVLVVHGFPPRAMGGTEIYAESHARELVRAGDHVLVIAREADPSAPEHRVRQEQRDGIEIVWINNTFASVRSFAESYDHPGITARAAEAIDAFRPDIAHVHHLTCLSTSILTALSRRRVPIVMTLHDYWPICHRGQLLDTSMRLCAGPEPDGCASCVPAEAAAAGPVLFAGGRLLRRVTRVLPARVAERVLAIARRAGARGAAARGAGARAVAARGAWARAVARGPGARGAAAGGASGPAAGVASGPATQSSSASGRDRRTNGSALGSASQQASAARMRHMRDVLSQVTMFIAPSRFIRDRFVQFGIDPSRISVREIGVPAAQPATEPARESAPRTPGTSAPVVVGFLGSLLPSKAPHLLFEAAALLPPDSIRIEIAGAFAAYHGDTSYEAAFRRAAAAPAPGPATSPALMRGPLARDEAQSVLRGPLGRNEVSAFLGGLDVLVVPSVWPENSPLVIREAFAAGVPVVASRIGGIPEMVDDGRNGLLVEPGDATDLARVLRRLIDEPGLLDGLRRHLPGPIPTMETDVAALRALYGEVIGRADAGTRWATDTPTAGGRDQEVWASGPPVGPLAHPQGPLTQAPGSLPLRTAWAAGPPMDPRAAGPPPGATGPNREIDSPRVAWAAGPPIDAGAAGPPMDACAAGPPIDAGAADPPTAVAGPHTRAEAPTIIAVVLNYKTPDDTWLAVRSLLLSDRRVDHIVVVDNDDTSAKSAAPAGSSRTLSAPETLAGASPALVLPPSDGNRITHIAPGRNVGFAAGVNLGITEALARGAERIFLLNSDALIGRHTLAGLERALNDAPNAGITGPVILDRRNPDCVASAGISFNRATGRMRNENFPGAGGGVAGGAGGAGASVREVDAASGCALLITRDTFERVGLFDEDYFFSFEDVDFCTRAADAGIHTVVTTEATVLHEGSRSIGAASPERLYFGARNQLLAARRRNRDASGLTTALRATFIVGLNVAHAFRARGGSLPSRLLAVARGSLDYARCRLGDPRDRLGDARG